MRYSFCFRFGWLLDRSTAEAAHQAKDEWGFAFEISVVVYSNRHTIMVATRTSSFLVCHFVLRCDAFTGFCFINTSLAVSAIALMLTRVLRPSIPPFLQAPTRADRLDRKNPPTDEGGDGTAVPACQPTVCGSHPSPQNSSTSHPYNGSRISAGHNTCYSHRAADLGNTTIPFNTRISTNYRTACVLGRRYSCLLSSV